MTAAELTLPHELTIYSVAELRTAWRRWLDAVPADTGDDPCDICLADGAAVREVDAAGLQLLLALSNQLAGRQRTLHVQNPSPALALACHTLGLSALLADAGTDGAHA